MAGLGREKGQKAVREPEAAGRDRMTLHVTCDHDNSHKSAINSALRRFNLSLALRAEATRACTERQ